MNNRQIIIYTDGCSLGNPGKGGWAAVLSTAGKTKEITGGYRLTTNNRMELMAVVRALSALTVACNNVTLFTDSQLITNAMNKGWLKAWIAAGWRKADKKPVINIDLWKQIVELTQKHNVKFIWVAGHSGNQGNERCDVLCKNAAEAGEDIDVEYEMAATGFPVGYGNL